MTSSSEYCVGIDLGTTNTVCAVWERGKRTPEIIDISQPVDFTTGTVERSGLLPSVLSIQEEGLFVGKVARQAWRLGRGKTFTSTKRNMGKPWISPTEFDWTPERVAGAVLSVVRQELGKRYGSLPLGVVITVPASFGTEARRATLLAARMAGFAPETLRLFDEPTAALLAELQRNDEPTTNEPRRVMVIDIGGGTLDVSLVALSRDEGKTVFDVQGQSRLNTLAGDDFDLNIAGLLLKRFLEERRLEFKFIDRLARARLCADLLIQAESVKTRLSSLLRGEKPNTWKNHREAVSITETPDQKTWTTELHGEDLAIALLQYFPLDANPKRRREEVTFFRPIQECLDAARDITGKEVEPTEVWLTGGSAYLPFIPYAVQKVLAVPNRLVFEPMNAVAMGAAWFAGLQDFGDGRTQVRERMFEGIYLQAADQSFVELVGAREEIPMARVERRNLLAMPMADHRVEVDLFVGFAGSSPDTRKVEAQLMPLARRRISFPEPLPEGQSITVGVEVTANREVVLDFTAYLGERRISGQVTASLAFGGASRGSERPLQPVNVFSRGGES